jgi:hypothetical protein
MQVFSPGRFVPAYWERFDPPDLAKEFEDLDLRTRVVPLGKILTEEELGRFKDKVNAALAAWIDWRRRAIDTGILTALRKIGGRKAIDAAFQQWVDENRGLKQEWDDLGDTIDELHRDLTRMAAMIDTRAAEQPDSPAEYDGDAECTHTEDFSSVCWYGESFQFNRTESKCVRLLWEAWSTSPGGHMTLHQDTIRDGIESESETFRLALVFRHRGKPNRAWGRMIHSLGNGRFYLAKPTEKSPAAKQKPAKKNRIT